GNNCTSSHVGFDVVNFFFHIKTWEDWCSFSNYCGTFWETSQGQVFKIKIIAKTKLFHDSIYGAHHKWLDQMSHHAQTSRQICHYSCQLIAFGRDVSKNRMPCLVSLLV